MRDVRSLIGKLRSRDPDLYALHRAIRVAVVMPSAFAFTFEVIGNPTLATFTAFGCFALLLFVDLPGNPSGRLTGYAMLAVTGAVLITLGTLASRYTWVAVAAMVVVGFAVLFAGALSASIAAAARAALLVFILPVTLPGGPADIAPRLAGWGIAVAVAVPVAMLVWPPREHDDLRRYAADTCRAIADVVTAGNAGEHERADALRTDVSTSLDALRRTFRGTAFRPVGLTTGSRALIRLVEELEWLGSVVLALSADEMRAWPELARATTGAAADVLTASAGVLGADRRASLEDDHGLGDAIDRLGRERRRVASEFRASLDPATSSAAGLPSYQGHEVSHAAALIGATVAWAAEADARPVFDRLLGRPAAHTSTLPLSPVVQIATSQVERHSVWLQNSIRGALGLGLAVMFADLTGAQHAFWAVLGALSVLRSTALSTGSTALRALLGTLVGFVVGAGVVVAIGSNSTVLWVVLPVAILVAAFVPEAISFAAGQAAFTVVLLILFNIVAPIGWQVGLVRVEDVALGCAASLVVGVLVWPRGAAAAIGTALSEAYHAGTVYLDSAVAYSLRTAGPPTEQLRDMLAAGRRLDDALRQYLAERGAKPVPLDHLTAAANGATRLRLAGEAITAVRAMGGRGPDLHAPFAATTRLVHEQAAAVRDFYDALADAFDPHHPGTPPASPEPVDHTDGVLDALHADLVADAACGADTEQAKRLYWTSLHLQDMLRLETRLGSHYVTIPGAPAELSRSTA
jgi:uncharacterized membrane protein YccC